MSERSAAGRIEVPVFFTSDGERTCARDFGAGEYCPFFRTRQFGQQETCLFADEPPVLNRRGKHGTGFLIPGDWCPVKVEKA